MFSLENKTRQIVAEMMLAMNDRVVQCMRDVRACQQGIDGQNHKLQEIIAKQDREAKIKDLVQELKLKLTTMVSETACPLNRRFQEKTMARDIAEAIENNENLTLHLKMMSENVKEIGKERGVFIAQ